MKLEISLVKLPSYESLVATSLVSRTSLTVNSDSEALDAITSFIGDNIDIIDSATSDKSFVANLQKMHEISINNLYEIKLQLALYSGLDIWFWYLSESEISKSELDSGVMEFTILDSCAMQSMFIQNAIRYYYTQEDLKFTELYTSIKNAYGLFQSGMSEATSDPISNLIDGMKPSEDGIGVIPESYKTYMTTLLEYFGKKIYLIME